LFLKTKHTSYNLGINDDHPYCSTVICWLIAPFVHLSPLIGVYTCLYSLLNEANKDLLPHEDKTLLVNCLFFKNYDSLLLNTITSQYYPMQYE